VITVLEAYSRRLDLGSPVVFRKALNRPERAKPGFGWKALRPPTVVPLKVICRCDAKRGAHENGTPSTILVKTFPA
jgi:hypothetical protein